VYLRDQQGVSPQVKEVIMDTYLIRVERFFPKPYDALLQIGLWRFMR